MIYTIETKRSCEEVEEKVEEESKSFGLILKKHYPFSKHLPQTGLAINNHASVFELCKAPIAAKVLNAHPELSLLLPCRISIFEKEGRSYASTHDLLSLFENLECEAQLKEEILGLYKNITDMMKSW
ncbi:MAG TPA: DUF302 domain-containing protein [Sulfurimonas sp.]|nr:DUF302 domain-containing protein [Sulfurimonas sp.]